jgi:uncharacterized DUF497 family protein
MKTKLTWDEKKRQGNIVKHGFDFADADLVLGSDIRLDIAVFRNGEERVQSFAYVFDRLAVLTLVHVARDNTTRIISFRPANETESEEYYGWLETADKS